MMPPALSTSASAHTTSASCMTATTNVVVIFLLMASGPPVCSIILARNMWLVAPCSATYCTWRLKLSRWSIITSKYLNAKDGCMIYWLTYIHTFPHLSVCSLALSLSCVALDLGASFYSHASTSATTPLVFVSTCATCLAITPKLSSEKPIITELAEIRCFKIAILEIVFVSFVEGCIFSNSIGGIYGASFKFLYYLDLDDWLMNLLV